MRKPITLILVIFFLFVFSSCGGGGAQEPGDQNVDRTVFEGEGTAASPVNLGTVGQPVSHAGSIKSVGTSYYSFRTDADGGKYNLSLKNTHTNLILALYSGSDWSGQVMDCDNIFTDGDIVCVTSYSDLAPDTDYYIKVSEWNFSSDTYTLGISRIESEGTTASPILLTVGTAHSGSVDAAGSSYYKFQATTSGEYRISIANLPGSSSSLGIQIFASDFTSPNLLKSCSAAYSPVCTVNGLTQDTYYYVQVTPGGSYATYDALYDIIVEKGTSEGSIASPVELTYGQDHEGAVSGLGSSYYMFTPTNTGDSIITLTATSSLSVTVYSDPAFSSGQMQLCYLATGGVCTVSNVNQGVHYYLLVSSSTGGKTYTINVSAGDNEGSLSQPVGLALDQTHSAAIDANGISYYRFTTAESGSYTITLNTTLASTYWSLYQDQNFTEPIYSIYTGEYNSTVVTNQCGHTCTTYYYQAGGKTYYNLDGGTTYYLTVTNNSAVSGTFTLTEATGTGNSEGSINDPVVLTEGTPWSGRVGAHIISFYTFTPSQSANYLIRLTNIEKTTGDWGLWVNLYSDAGFVTTLGPCRSHSYYTTYDGDLICAVNSFTSPVLSSLTAGTPYYIMVENHDFYTPNSYSISVMPYAPSLGCNGGGATCFDFESGIPAAIDPNPTAPLATESPWAPDSGSAGSGAWSFTSTKPNGNVSSYYSCFRFDASNIKWIGYSLQIATTGTDSMRLDVYDASGGWLDWKTLGSGNTTWRRNVYIPPVNAYTYEWCYDKTSAATGDAAWIDDIELN